MQWEEKQQGQVATWAQNGHIVPSGDQDGLPGARDTQADSQGTDVHTGVVEGGMQARETAWSR